MKDTYSNIFSFNKKILGKTIKVLNQGSVVGLPTETVYGLAGNAYSKNSINRIYKLKKRPKLNPLIVHYYDYKKAINDVILNTSLCLR
jgi:L-threonylcarbamoyladenylate synthase